MSTRISTVMLLSNEQLFIKELIKFIVNNSNGKITCPNYDSIDFSYSSSSTVTFTLRFLDKYNIKFTRLSANRSTEYRYIMLEDGYGNGKSETMIFSYEGSTSYLTDITVRKIDVKLILSDKIVLLQIGSANPILFIDEENFEWYYWGDCSYTAFCPKKKNKTTLETISGYQFNRFLYYYNRENFDDIQVVGNKIFVNTNSSSSTKQRLFDTNLFLDCSYVPSNIILSFNNHKFYSLNFNLLIPCE